MSDRTSYRRAAKHQNEYEEKFFSQQEESYEKLAFDIRNRKKKEKPNHHDK